MAKKNIEKQEQATTMPTTQATQATQEKVLTQSTTNVVDSDPNNTVAGKNLVSQGEPLPISDKEITLPEKQDTTMKILEYSKSDCSISAKKFDYNLKNVKDADYFKSALHYRNLIAVKKSISAHITELESKRDKETDADSKTAYNELISSLEKGVRSMEERISDHLKKCEDSGYTRDEMINDSFILLVAHGNFNEEMSIPDSLMIPVMNTLKAYKNEDHKDRNSDASREKFLEFKTALQAVCDYFNTPANERYFRSYIKANNHMYSHISDIFTKSVKRNENGFFVYDDAGASKKKIQTEILRIIIGKLQGSIKSETSVEKPE